MSVTFLTFPPYGKNRFLRAPNSLKMKRIPSFRDSANDEDTDYIFYIFSPGVESQADEEMNNTEKETLENTFFFGDFSNFCFDN